MLSHAGRNPEIELFFSTLQPDIGALTTPDVAAKLYFLSALNSLDNSKLADLNPTHFAIFKSFIILLNSNIYLQRIYWFRKFGSLFAKIVTQFLDLFDNQLNATLDAHSLKESPDKLFDDNCLPAINKLLNDLHTELKKAATLEEAMVLEFDSFYSNAAFLEELIEDSKRKLSVLFALGPKSHKEITDIVSLQKLKNAIFYASSLRSTQKLQKGNLRFNLNVILPEQLGELELPFAQVPSSCSEGQYQELLILRNEYIKNYKEAKLQLSFIMDHSSELMPGLSKDQFETAYIRLQTIIDKDYTIDFLISMYKAYCTAPNLQKQEALKALNLHIHLANKIYSPGLGVPPITLPDIALQSDQTPAPDVATVLNNSYSILTGKPISAFTLPAPTIQVLDKDKDKDEKEKEDKGVKTESLTSPRTSYQLMYESLSSVYDGNVSPNDRCVAIAKFDKALLKAETIEEIADLYEVTEPYINRHRNPDLDEFFDIDVTDSWRHEAEKARAKALLLFASTAKKDSKQATKLYDTYRNKGLFSEHLKYSLVYNFFGPGLGLVLTRPPTEAQDELDRCMRIVNKK